MLNPPNGVWGVAPRDVGGRHAPALSKMDEKEAARLGFGFARSHAARDLRQVSRRFTHATHPDRYPVSLRPRRPLRMTLVKALIDEALQSLCSP